MHNPPRVLAVDDTPANLRLIEAVLVPEGYEVRFAKTGAEGMDQAHDADIVLLDVHLPDIDGFEVCKRLRADPATTALPIIMVTATASTQRLAGLQSGADDFVPKPFDAQELIARVRSLLRVKELHDQLASERSHLAEQVAEQVAEIATLTNLRRFLPDVLAHAIAAESSLLEPHRREIAVLFADLRGFTAFSVMAEPEDVIRVLRDYHELIGGLVGREQATVGYFQGDGVMLFWNDPLPCDDAVDRAARTGLDIVEGIETLNERWQQLGYRIGVGVGVAAGYATIGMLGFEGRYDYTALGPVVNLASRLSDEARDGKPPVLLDQRAHAALGGQFRAVELPELLDLPGFPGPLQAWSVATAG